MNRSTAVHWNQHLHRLIVRFRLYGRGEDEILEELAAQLSENRLTARSFRRLMGPEPLEERSRTALADLYGALADTACVLMQDGR